MKYTDGEIFRCPLCRNSLVCHVIKEEKAAGEEVKVAEGYFDCDRCKTRYPIINSIPRFAFRENYARSFGYQWKKFATTQLGDAQKTISRNRFTATTKWTERCDGEYILEVGSGAGRFTEIALELGGILYSFDLSEAVEANLENIRSKELKNRLHLFQASLYAIPLPDAMFDKIFCFGVLQHCPDVKKAYISLARFLKPGGELAADCYLKQPFKDFLNLKYILRPIFKWWKPRTLFTFCAMAISVLYDVKLAVSKIAILGDLLARLIPIGKLSYEPEYHFTIQQIKEIKTLSMVDMLSPKYDQPMRMKDFVPWTAEAGLELIELTKGYNGINVRARKRCNQ